MESLQETVHLPQDQPEADQLGESLFSYHMADLLCLSPHLAS